MRIFKSFRFADLSRRNIIILIIIILVLAFYWYEWRPSQIRKECYKTAEYWSKGSGWAFDYHYKQCLRSRGY